MLLFRGSKRLAKLFRNDIIISGDIMKSIEDVQVAMNKNAYLTDEIKANIMSLVSIFHNRFPNVDLDNLCKNLTTLKIDKATKFITLEPISYNGMLNVLSINKGSLKEVPDAKNLLMSAIICMIATNQRGITGFCDNPKFEALNAGYVAGMANMLVGNDSDVDYYTDEIIATNLFGQIVGPDVLAKAFFENNSSIIVNQFMNAGE